MKKQFALLAGIAALALLSACGAPAAQGGSGNGTGGGTQSGGFINPGDVLGGGGTVETLPDADAGELPEEVTGGGETAGSGTEGESLPEGGKITAAGEYKVSGSFEGKISVKAEGVRLILENAVLTNDKKVIESDYPLALTLVGENTLENTEETDNKNAVDVAGALVINGEGSLKITSQKNAIKADSITVQGASLDLTAQSDGLHAEISAYDDLTEAPAFTYETGFVVLDGATLKATVKDDGIQADSYVYIKGESNVNITTNGGAPATITEVSSDSGDGKGIKAGALDWGADDTELTVKDYLIAIESGTVTVNANDDGIHSDGDLYVLGGTLDITAGDDALHCEELLAYQGGELTVRRSYEGVEGAKVEISGGKMTVNAVDDGINAADGTQSVPGRPNSNCHLIISGGEIYVNAEGDGVDSNGTMLFSGGRTFVSGSTRGDNCALDSDGGILVNGGYLFAVGALGMVETPANNSAQNVVSFAQQSAVAAGTYLALTGENGEIFSYECAKACQSVILSCPELETGKSYSIYGGETKLVDFTVSSVITSVGSSTQPGGPGTRPGFPGGGPGGRW